MRCLDLLQLPYRATKSIFWFRICEGFNDHNVGFQLNRQGFIEISHPRVHKNPWEYKQILDDFLKGLCNTFRHLLHISVYSSR